MHNEFNGHTLSKVEATLQAFVSDADYMNPDPSLKTRLYWGLDIRATLDSEDELFLEAMRFYHDTLSFPDELRSWEMLLGQKVEWEDRYYMGIEGSYPAFYLQIHQPVEAGKINFIEREADKFRVTWNGVTEEGNFSIDTWVTFKGVQIFHHMAKGEEVADVLARHLNSDKFYEEPLAHPSQTYTRFKPKLETAE